MARKAAPPTAPITGMASLFQASISKAVNSDKSMDKNALVDIEKFFACEPGIDMSKNLPLCYLLGIDVLLFGRSYQIAGPPGSTKSQFLWYLFSQVLYTGGIVGFVPTEGKDNPYQYRGIIKNDAAFKSNAAILRAKTTEETCGNLTKLGNTYLNVCPNNEVPMAIGIDSLTGNTSASSHDSVAATGVAKGGYASAKRAAVLTEYLHTFNSQFLENRSLMLFVVNHQKKKLEEGAMAGYGEQTSEAGGVGKDFAYTWNFSMKKIKSLPPLKTTNTSRLLVQIKTKKSGFSETGYKIKVPVMTTFMAGSADGSEQKLSIQFDWDWALGNMLTHEEYKKAYDISSVIKITGAGNKVSCAQLNLKDVTLDELGRAVHADADLIEKLKGVFKIFVQKLKFQSIDGTACGPMDEYTPPHLRDELKAVQSSGEDEASSDEFDEDDED